MVDAYLVLLKLFQGVSFFLVDCDFFLWGLGGGEHLQNVSKIIL